MERRLLFHRGCCLPESRLLESRLPESRLLEPRLPEPRLPEPCLPELRFTETGIPDFIRTVNFFRFLGLIFKKGCNIFLPSGMI